MHLQERERERERERETCTAIYVTAYKPILQAFYNHCSNISSAFPFLLLRLLLFSSPRKMNHNAREESTFYSSLSSFVKCERFSLLHSLPADVSVYI